VLQHRAVAHLTAGATFYGELDASNLGVYAGARVGMIAPASAANTFTMAYTESNGATSANATGNFILDVGDDGRATTTDADSGAASVFYFVSANEGFIVGSTVVTGDSQRKFFGTFEPQSGTPFDLGTLNGDYVFGTEPLETLTGDASTGVVHIDGAGHGMVVVDTKAADGTLSAGITSTWTLAASAGGAQTFLITPASGQAYFLAPMSATRSAFLSSPPLTQWPNLFLLER
jgi:hypothetical protein